MDSNKSKMPTYSKNSKMRQYEIVFDEEIEQYRAGFYKSKFLDYVFDNNDDIYTVEPGYEHRTDLISFKFYGSARWDWVIEDANNIEDPIKDIVSGLRLIIPNKSKIYASKF